MGSIVVRRCGVERPESKSAATRIQKESGGGLHARLLMFRGWAPVI